MPAFNVAGLTVIGVQVVMFAVMVLKVRHVFASIAVKTMLYLPGAVGVPEIRPVEENVKPGGTLFGFRPSSYV